MVHEGQPHTLRREFNHADCRISQQEVGRSMISQGAINIELKTRKTLGNHRLSQELTSYKIGCCSYVCSLLYELMGACFTQFNSLNHLIATKLNL